MSTYGIGDGDTGSIRLQHQLLELIERSDHWRELGEFSRRYVAKHHSLASVSDRLAQLLRRAASERRAPAHLTLADALRTSMVYLRGRRFIQQASTPASMQWVGATRSAEPAAMRRS